MEAVDSCTVYYSYESDRFQASFDGTIPCVEIVSATAAIYFSVTSAYIQSIYKIDSLKSLKKI
jgi:hypothetical protein